jgi:hypothetical protein
MPRPKDQETLLKVSENQFKILINLIEKMSDQEKQEPFCFNPEEQGKEAHWKRDQNIKDVLIHLYEWHVLLLKWVKSNQQGNHTTFSALPL